MRRAPNASTPIREEDPSVTADEQAAATHDPAKRVTIFDTTLRDGEQAPGITLNTREKVEIAHQLARLGVDVIEAGFPISSTGDFEATRAVAEEVPGVVVAGLARANERDVERAGEAVAPARRGRIHTFIATSDIHLTYKLKMTREQVLAAAVSAVRLARSITDDVEFSCEDATRSDPAFVAEVIGAAIAEGATTINLPDTVGYTMPTEYQGFLLGLYDRCPALRDVVLSVHCHNDLGLAVANSLSGVQVGARQVEGCVNGIGERAGNASVEELAMVLRTRADALGGIWCGVNTPEITRTSRMVSRMTGYVVQPNKAVVGRNAFAHEAGIHQHGVLSNPLTYEIMDVASVGLTQSEIVLGKHSGRHALQNALLEMGYELDRDELNQAFERFKDLADRKGRISAADLEAIVGDEMRVEGAAGGFELVEHAFAGSRSETPHARVVVTDPEGARREAEADGDGPVDALMKAIDAAAGSAGRLVEYNVSSVTSGKDALGEARVVCEIDGRRFAGTGVSTDVLEASAIAYVRAVNASRHAEHGERVVGGV
jgi:2-isopropylmalate synthase